MNHNTNFLTYGCVVSIVFDHNDSMPLKNLDYDSDKEMHKFHTLKSKIENKLANQEESQIKDESFLKKIKENKGQSIKKNEEMNNFLGNNYGNNMI